MSGSGRRPPARSRGLHGRTGFSLFKSALSPSAGQQEMQPLLTRPRRTSPPVGRLEACANSSLSSSSNSGSYKGSDSSPTPRRSSKYSSCSENHGIKPPTPEQYLTPLQQKEVCIRHLRAKLKETEEKLDERATEVEDLKLQLSRMQEDWIEEECHRVEAQLSLKEARKEIKQLKQVIDTVKNNLVEKDKGIQKYFIDINIQNRKLETLLQNMEVAQDGTSRSASASPARSLTRSSTYTKLSEPAAILQGAQGSPVPHHSSLASGIDRAIEGPSFTARPRPSLGRKADGGVSQAGTPRVNIRDQSVQTDHLHHSPESETAMENVLGSGASSPSGVGPEGEPPGSFLDLQTCLMLSGDSNEGSTDGQSIAEMLSETASQGEAEDASDQLSHWSRYYMVDLLAVIVPALPTLAWIIHTQRGRSQPLYNLGVLLRSCCVIALHSLRRLNTNVSSPHFSDLPS
ncbi:syntaphilin isoform X1 [Amblyraja radiata]|uniref:syntaphilin isoform X1 n=1 Tax=Amblyraja radiata TaxID=386614 RepID=UPI001402B82D|nr:syntaphilin isoform X1 [Amblyraja radiata]XP_032897611.1 syntaphilin isoform X1 [Amblyraja radiata]XP_032897612.1 syntaphilin isoform X1 [Amblyraja radiata]XP_032897613.1 syntaphilin isoform X1 [Amblyraja radiata]